MSPVESISSSVMMASVSIELSSTAGSAACFFAKGFMLANIEFFLAGCFLAFAAEAGVFFAKGLM